MRADVADAVLRSTVAIVAEVADMTSNVPAVGTGFCVDARGVIATAAHVLEMFKPPNSETLMSVEEMNASSVPIKKHGGPVPCAIFFTWRKGNLRAVRARMHSVVLVESEQHDMALCALEPVPSFPLGFPALKTMYATDVYPGMDAGICGYPHAPLPEDLLRIKTPMLAKGIVGSVAPFPGAKNLKHFQLDINAARGSSGGPAFCIETGKAFGIVQGGITRDEREPPRQGVVRVDPLPPLFANDRIEHLLKDSPTDETYDDWARDRMREIVRGAKLKLADLEEMRRAVAEGRLVGQSPASDS